ncbi:Stk1 family PASTA domain-containing Ser/Thr kinase [Oenococcus oeni]
MNPGSTFANRYRIIRPLGEGGMANVYLAVDTKNNQQVAIKVLRLDLQNNPDFVRRFQREAQAAAQLLHSNIVKVLDAGSFDGVQYLTMEYVDGMDLKKYISQYYPVPYAQVVNIMEQVLSAVSMAHNHGIVHRDLKPQNILVGKDGSIKIVDFGIAIARSEFGMTQTNAVLGSVHYLSPEQTRGGMATNKSDIYALGVILFEMLTGQVPYKGETVVSIAMKHSSEQMPSAKDIDPNIPQALENVILRATAKNPDNRYLTAEDMANDLRTSLSPRRANEAKLPPFTDDQAETRTIPIDDLKSQVASGIQRLDPVYTPLKDNPDSTSDSKKVVPGKKKKRKHKIWPWILAGLLAIDFGVILVAMFWPGRVQVPDTANYKLSVAEKLIRENDLEVGSISETTSRKVKKGRVIKSDPKIGSHVAKNTKIDLIVSNGAKKLTFGDYVGSNYSDVASVLRNQGYKVKKVEKYSNSVSSGQIIKQSVDADKKVDPYETTVKFTVSKGAQKITVPTFDSLSEAQSWADQNGITLKITYSQSSDTDTGYVISQNPNGGTEISSSTVVHILVAQRVDNSSSSSSSAVPSSSSSMSSSSNGSSSSSSNSSSSSSSSISSSSSPQK